MTIPFLRYIKHNIIPIDIPAIRICDYLYDYIGFKETSSLMIFDSEYYCIINFNKNQFPFNFDEKIDHIKFRKLLFFNENNSDFGIKNEFKSFVIYKTRFNCLEI